MAGRPKEITSELIGKASAYLDTCTDNISEKIKKVSLPSIEGFALFLGIHRDTVYDWESKSKTDTVDGEKDPAFELYEQFSDILARVRQEQAKRLIDNGLSGNYNPTIAKLLLSSKHDYVEKTETDVKSGGKPLQGGIMNVINKVYGAESETSGEATPNS